MDNDYKTQARLRRIKQLFMVPVFLVILIVGWRYPVLGYFIPFCMVLGIGFGLWRGRIWCDWLCPRGSFYDSLVSAISPKKEIPALFKKIPFRLGVIAFLMGLMTVNLVLRWPDTNKIGLFFVILLTSTTALGIILALIFHQRSWCSICPIGTLVNLVGGKRFPLKIDSSLCIDCKKCNQVCPIQIKPSAYKREGMQLVKDPDCFKCNLCVAVCPTKALKRDA
jgi:polyferredoxin